MERTLNRNLLKYAVQRSMFNSDGSVADVRKSVLVEVTIAGGPHAVELMSGAKFDSLPPLADTVASLPAGSTIEVWDGRYLFGSAKSHSGYLRFEAPAARCPEHGTLVTDGQCDVRVGGSPHSIDPTLF